MRAHLIKCMFKWVNTFFGQPIDHQHIRNLRLQLNGKCAAEYTCYIFFYKIQSAIFNNSGTSIYLGLK